MTIHIGRFIPSKLRIKWPPLPYWAINVTEDVQSVLSLTPVVLLLGTFVICFLWYDMQNRFMKVGDRIVANQIVIREALASSRRAESDIARVQTTLNSAQVDVEQVESNAAKIREVLHISNQTLLDSQESRNRIIEAYKYIAVGATEIKKLRESSEEAVHRSRDNAAKISETTQLAQSTEEIVRNLAIGQMKIDSRLEDIQDKLQRLLDRKSK